MICHPRANQEALAWFRRLVERRIDVFLPEIADYELRRELIRARLAKSVERLNLLKTELRYLPINTTAMLRAAELWAQARNRGTPTADPKELDGDVILAAQAEQVGAIVVTDNVGHLARFVKARNWREIS